MDLKEFLSRDLTSKKVEEKGQNLYKNSKLLMFIGLCGIGLAIIMGLISLILGGEFFYPFIFEISGYEFAIIFIIADYIALLCGIIGIGWYHYSLNLFAIGRIAANTENLNSASNPASNTQSTAQNKQSYNTQTNTQGQTTFYTSQAAQNQQTHTAPKTEPTQQSSYTSQATQSSQTSTTTNNAQNTQQRPSYAPLGADQKRCWSCGTAQSSSNKTCTNCGQNISFFN